MAKKACVVEFVTASGFKSMFNVLESLHKIHFFQVYLLVWKSDLTLTFLNCKAGS